MGNQQGKPGGNEQQEKNGPGGTSLSQLPDSQKSIGNNMKKQPENRQNNNTKQKDPVMNNTKIQSRGPSALDNYRNKTNLSSKRNSPQLIAGPSNQTSKRNSPQLIAGSSNVQGGQQQQPQQQAYMYDDEEDENQFMPLMKLDPTGQIRLRITLVELVLEKSPKPHLKKSSSLYNSTMLWKKDSRNIFAFSLKQDQGYELVMEVDIQGNTLNNKDQVWSALCPINIPLGQSVKVGQMTCVNWYCKLEFNEDEEEDEQILGPSIKNIDFKISEETFGKWGQKVPKSFYNEPNTEVIKKIYRQEPEQFVPYKQLSRYFDSKNIWRASTYFEQTTKYFRGWVIEVTDHNSVATISKELHSDLKNRENFYAKTIFERQFGGEGDGDQQ